MSKHCGVWQKTEPTVEEVTSDDSHHHGYLGGAGDI
jgi:hypothetical protein